MSEDNNDLEQLGRKLGRALRTSNPEGAPASLRAQIRRATTNEMILPGTASFWRWIAAPAFALALIAVVVWQMPRDARQSVANIAALEREFARPLLLLEAAIELEEDNHLIAMEVYREACSTATHPAVAWMAANEVRRLEGDSF